MANTPLGTATDFGSNDVVLSFTGLGTLVLQDWEFSNEADQEEVRDETGNIISQVFYNPTKRLKASGVVKGTGLANALTQSKVPAPGVIGTVTSTNYTPIADTHWQIVSATLKATNTKNKMIDVELINVPGVTAGASA